MADSFINALIEALQGNNDGGDIGRSAKKAYQYLFFALLNGVSGRTNVVQHYF